jgi:hypothetical protein
MSGEVYVHIRGEFSPGAWRGSAPKVETFALLHEDDLAMLRAYIQEYYAHEYGFDAAREYQNLKLIVVREEREPSKVAVLHEFLGDKLVFGADIVEQLFSELEHLRAEEAESYAGPGCYRAPAK